MDHEFERRLQAWVDGQLDPTEARAVAATVEKDAEARQLAQNLRSLSGLLQTHAPEPTVPESRDFYWSRIRNGIEQADRGAERVDGWGSRQPGLLRWLAWLVPTGAAAFAAVLFLQPSNPYPLGLTPAIPVPALTDHEIETPSDEVSSLTFYASEDSMTVVWLGRIDFL